MKGRFGEEWFEPKELIIYPQFVFEKFNISEKCGQNVHVQQQFFEVVKDLKNQNKLHGYFMLNFDFSVIQSDDPLEIQPAFISNELITIIELESTDTEKNINELQEQLKDRIRAVDMQVGNTEIPVNGIIVFPNEDQPSSSLPASYPILCRKMYKENGKMYEKELKDALKDKLGPGKPPEDEKSLPHLKSIEEPIDVKNTIAELLRFNMLKRHYPESEEEAIYEVAKWLFCQWDDEEVTEFTRMPFSSIKLNLDQKSLSLKEHLLKSGDHCSIVSAAYGIRTSVIIVSALRELLTLPNSRVKKVLFLSAQGLLADQDLIFSPFLHMIEKWFADSNQDNQEQVKIIPHTNQYLLKVDSLADGLEYEDMVFSSYLLKHADLQSLLSGGLKLNIFDIIVMEETHAIDQSQIEKLVNMFDSLKMPKFWITLNSESLEPLPSTFREIRGKDMESLRNVASHFIPERFSSNPKTIPTSGSGLDVASIFELDNQKRIQMVVEMAEKWDWAPKCDILFIDCESRSENSVLFQELNRKGIAVCRWNESSMQHTSKFLFLQRFDPIEAILAGAEWPVLIIHAKVETLEALDAVGVFSKRVISRVTTKLYLFSDSPLSSNTSKSELGKHTSSSQFEDDTCIPMHKQEGVDTFIDKSSETHSSVKHEHKEENSVSSSECVDRRVKEKIGNDESPGCGKQTRATDDDAGITQEAAGLFSLIEHIKNENKDLTEREVFSFKEFQFFHIQHAPDNILENTGENIYLVKKRDKIFLLEVTPDVEKSDVSGKKVIEKQERIKSLLREDLFAYCNDKLIHKGRTKNPERILKCFHLLAAKNWEYKESGHGVNDGNGHLSAKDLARGLKNSKYYCLSLYCKGDVA